VGRLADAGGAEDDWRMTMTTVPARSTFESAYAGQAPWDIGKPKKLEASRLRRGLDAVP
jgi:hypothetical protein